MRIISSSVGNICLSVNISNSTQIIMEFASPSTTFDLCHPVFFFFFPLSGGVMESCCYCFYSSVSLTLPWRPYNVVQGKVWPRATNEVKT